MNKENIKIIIILIASVAVFLYTLTLFTTEEFNKEAAVENIFINCQTSAMQINSPDKFVEEQDMEHIASLFPPILD
ncbi:hypothetical protein KC669_05045, partial [Candidatus Dojkabacteria bacterium]|nr:hypothetical protein [Candidatus Dojkabacteria bacterium]